MKEWVRELEQRGWEARGGEWTWFGCWVLGLGWLEESSRVCVSGDGV